MDYDIPGVQPNGTLPDNCTLLTGGTLPAPIAHRLVQCPYWHSPDTLLGFQEKAIEEMLRWKRTTLWARRGAGKTRMGLAWLMHRRGPWLVATPDGVVSKFVGEIRRHTPLTPVVLRGHKTAPIQPKEGEIYIIGWRNVLVWRDELLRAGFRSLIFDEVHWLKNPRRARQVLDLAGRPMWEPVKTIATTARELSRGATYVLGMSGTGIPDSLDDLWGQLDVISPWQWGTHKDFCIRYCGATINPFNGMNIDPGMRTNTEELDSRLEWAITRVADSDVMKEMPPSTRELLWVDPKEQTLRGFEAAIKKGVRQGRKQGGMALLHAGLNEGTWQKWAVVQDRILESLRDGGNVLVFCGQHVQVETLATQLTSTLVKEKLQREVWWAHGDLSEKLVDGILHQYMTTGGALFVTYDRFKEGIDLQKTDLCVMMTLPWSPHVLLQAEGRVTRIGGDRPVTILYPMATGNRSEEAVFSSLLAKLPVVAAITQDQDAANLSTTLEAPLSEGDLLAAFLGGMANEEEEDS